MSEPETLARSIKEGLPNPSLEFWEATKCDANENLLAAQAESDSAVADKFWFLHKVALVREQYLKCFNDIKAGKFYDAWCGLERAEIELSWLKRNPFFCPTEFGVLVLERQVQNWQSLFPYTIFFSPAILEKRKECGICGAVVDPWTACGHEVGSVYGGRECIHNVTAADFLEISIVLDPVQKYSVAHEVLDKDGNTVDHHDYSPVTFVADRLSSPFDGWSVRKTKAWHPHSRYSGVPPQAPCPCESGRRYADCCLTKRGVLRPHFAIEFEKEPPADLPTLVFSRDVSD
ncbi:MAG TPA: SEC-C domain-containing protein [Rhizomicrobium sp.]